MNCISLGKEFEEFLEFKEWNIISMHEIYVSVFVNGIRTRANTVYIKNKKYIILGNEIQIYWLGMIWKFPNTE